MFIYHLLNYRFRRHQARHQAKSTIENRDHRHPMYLGDDLTELQREVEIYDGAVLDDAQTEGHV